MNPLSILSSLVKPVMGAIAANTERKQAKESGLNAIMQAKVDGENSLNLTDAQWEAVVARGNESSWKDEYVTVICTSPYIAIFGGALAAALGYPSILSGSMEGVAKLEEVGIDVGNLAQTVVYAAVGLKLWRGR